MKRYPVLGGLSFLYIYMYIREEHALLNDPGIWESLQYVYILYLAFIVGLSITTIQSSISHQLHI